jgi:5-carboxymethyl-2-hydroxymuconate isomerase
MPHLVILYTANLDRPVADGGTDMAVLCRTLADTMLAARDETGQPVFPPGGVRVLAYPAPYFAAGRAAGASGDYGFVYLNLRMGRGRSKDTISIAGNALLESARAHFEHQLAHQHIGVTLQIDEGPEVFDGKASSLHPLFKKN